MIFIKTKINLEILLILIILIIINLFISISFFYNQQLYYSQFVFNDFFSSIEKKVTLSPNINILDGLDKIKDPFIIQIPITEQGEITIRNIYFNKKNNNPSMISGRFFDKSDFTNNKNNAVVGKSVFENLSNKSSISIDNQEYQIIGVIGDKTHSKIDKYILLSFQKEDLKSLNSFIIDGFEKTPTVTKTILSLDNQAEIKNRTNSSSVFQKGLIENIIIFITFLIFLSTIIIVSFSYIEKRKDIIFLKKIFGYKKSKIFLDFMIEYIGIIVISNIISLSIAFFLPINFSYVLLNLPKIFFISFTTSAISIYIPLSNRYKEGDFPK